MPVDSGCDARAGTMLLALCRTARSMEPWEGAARAGVSRTRTGCAAGRLAVRMASRAASTAATAEADDQRARNGSRHEERSPDKAVAPLMRTASSITPASVSMSRVGGGGGEGVWTTIIMC